MAVSAAPECLSGVANLPSSTWAALLAAVIRYGEELVTRQWSVVNGSQDLAEFEYAFERRLVGTLREYLGDVSVLAEEHFNHTGQLIEGTGSMRILLDPLDGSRVYSTGGTRYSIAIAGVVHDDPLFAIVHQPAEQRMYTAVRGRGAYLGALPIVAAGSAPRSVAMRRSPEAPVEVHRIADRLTRLGYTVQRLESTALKLCWIGSGEYAGLIKPVTDRGGVLCNWALAAGLLVATELGVAVRTLDARPWGRRAGQIAVGDTRFFDDIRPGSW